MRKIKLIVLLGVTLGLLAFGWNMPGIAHAESQTNCPVMGGKIDEKFFVDYQGKRIYFCCAGCIDEFKKDPEKYLKKMEAEGSDPGEDALSRSITLTTNSGTAHPAMDSGTSI